MCLNWTSLFTQADGVRNTPEKPGKPQNGTTPTKNVISPAQNAKISPAKPVDLTNSGKPAKSPKGIKDQAGAGPKSKDLGEITDAAGSAPETMPVSTTSPEGPKAASNSAPNETPVVSATPAAGANAKPANQNLVKVPCPNQPPSSPAIPAKGATPKSSSHSSTLSCSQTAKPIPSGCKQVTTGINSAVAGKPSDKSTKRNREDKIRKKDDKSIEHVFKALSNYETTEEKLGAMCQKYADIFNEHRMLQVRILWVVAYQGDWISEFRPWYPDSPFPECCQAVRKEEQHTAEGEGTIARRPQQSDPVQKPIRKSLPRTAKAK